MTGEGSDVSRLQSMILSNPSLAARFMTSMSADYWERAGAKRALELFHTAATQVRTYREFLADHRIDHTSIVTIDDFKRRVPLTDKQSHFSGRTLADLLVGEVADAHLFYMSGGTTGDSIIGAASRDTLRAYPASLAAIFNLMWDLCRPTNRVLMLNAMSLGAWIGGSYASAIYQQLSDQWPNISYVGPGADLDRVLDLIEALAPHFDTVVLTSYPTFVKEVLNAGTARGIDWRATTFKVVSSGERLDSKLREQILRTISDPVDRYAIMDQYGASEMGNPGFETPLASTIIRLAQEDSALCRDIFGTDQPHTLLQNNPVGAFMEIVDGRIVGTAGALMPVIRYTPKDLGRMIGFAEMQEIVRDHGIDLARSLAEDGWSKPLFQWPFLVVLGRADYAVSIYGAKVSPSTLQDLFAEDPVVKRFRLSTDDDGPYTVLRVDLELPEGVALSMAEENSMAGSYSDAILARLLDVNFDYADAYSIHADALVPRVAFHALGSGPFKEIAGSFKPKAL